MDEFGHLLGTKTDAEVNVLTLAVARYMRHAAKVERQTGKQPAVAAPLMRRSPRPTQGWHLEHRDTWIGATDAAAFLRFLGFEAVLVDFSSPASAEARRQAKDILEEIQVAHAAGRTDVASTAQQSLHSLWAMAGGVLLLLPRLVASTWRCGECGRCDSLGAHPSNRPTVTAAFKP
jgi:hypothetical protein